MQWRVGEGLVRMGKGSPASEQSRHCVHHIHVVVVVVVGRITHGVQSRADSRLVYLSKLRRRGPLATLVSASPIYREKPVWRGAYVHVCPSAAAEHIVGYA